MDGAGQACPIHNFFLLMFKKDDWLTRLGAFWLLACAGGPLAGWLLIEVVHLNLDNWRWLYALRVLLNVGLPLLTGLPLLRYLRGRGAWVGLAILLGVTLLAASSGWAYWQDLWSAPLHTAGDWLLPHTGRLLSCP